MLDEFYHYDKNFIKCLFVLLLFLSVKSTCSEINTATPALCIRHVVVEFTHNTVGTF